MNGAGITRSGQSPDSRQGGFALDEHAAQAVLKLGTEATQRRAIYLDMKYWIKLRHASQNKSNTTDHQLLSILRKGVAEGVLFCPISEAVFLEVMKQQDLTSRLATAQLIDELSLGTTLALERERIQTEIEYFMYWAAGGRKQQPIECRIWRRLGYVLGLVHPELIGIDPATSALLHRVFFRYMWEVSLREMIASMGDEDGSEPAVSDTTDAINEESMRHADELRSFEQAYNAEAKGLVDLFGDEAVNAVRKLTTGESTTPTRPRAQATREEENFSKNAVFFALKRNRARHILRTLHIHASLHAAVRWSKGRRLTSNDLDDFTHAAAALAYCDAFFTERSLRSTVTAGHVALDRLYGCYVAAAEDDAIAYASRLVTEE